MTTSGIKISTVIEYSDSTMAREYIDYLLELWDRGVVKIVRMDVDPLD